MPCRPATHADVVPIAALATQVFLDTYATDGVRPDLAREAFDVYSPAAFEARWAEAARRFIVAEQGEGIVGFAEILLADDAELVRLYVQPRAQGSGVGRALIGGAESLAASLRMPRLWLTVWERNERAIAFYRRSGYAQAGTSDYAFENRSYRNFIFTKDLAP